MFAFANLLRSASEVVVARCFFILSLCFGGSKPPPYDKKYHSTVGRGFISRRFYANVTLTLTREAERLPYNVQYYLSYGKPQKTATFSPKIIKNLSTKYAFYVILYINYYFYK